MSGNSRLLPILSIIFLAALLDGLDATIVGVSMPTICSELEITLENGVWVVLGYILGLASLLLSFGKMAKNGRIRKFSVWGTVLFTASSVGCGLSDSFWEIVIFRMIQGGAAAMMSSALPSIIVNMLPKDKKGLGMSVMGVSSGVSLVCGPTVGGIVTDLLGWHWLFFINVPIGAILVVLNLRFLEKDKAVDRSKDPSYVGAVTSFLFIGTALTLAENAKGEGISGEAMAVCAVMCLVSLVILVISVRRDASRAIIAPAMLLNREFVLVGTSFLLCTIVVAGATYLLPYFLQITWGMTPTENGLYLGIVSVAMLATALPVGRMCDRMGCKIPVVIAILARGTFCVMAYFIAPESGLAVLCIMLAIFGVSHAFSGTAQPTRMIHHATPGYEDESTNFMLVINYIANALGCVAYTLIFSNAVSGDYNLSFGELTGDMIQAGFHETALFGIALMGAALVCTLLVRNKIVVKDDSE